MRNPNDYRVNKHGAIVPIKRRKETPESRRAYRQRQRAGIGRGHFTGADITAKGERQGWRCYWCGQPCKAEYHIDHIVPLSKGGSNTADNICIACPPCNLSKGGQMPDEFLSRK